MSTFDDRDTTVDAPGAAPEQRTIVPCTPSQKRCWFISQLQPGTAVLNVPVLWEIRGQFNAATAEEAFRIIIARHEVLRTRLIEIDGEPMQEILGAAEFKLVEIDLSMLAESKREAQMRSIAQRETNAPLDPRKAPMIRAVLVRISDQRAFLVITVHQAAFDGWSIRVLGHELGTIMSALDAGKKPSLPDLPIQYGDYALWQQEFEARGGFAEDEAYWIKELRDAPYFEVTADFARRPLRTTNSASVTALLPPSLGAGLEEAAKRRGVSVFNFGIAVVASMLHRHTGKTDLVLGTQVAGRHDVDLEGLIGVFINNLALRLDASGDPSFDGFLTRTSQATTEALAHDRAPFHRVVSQLNAPRDPSRTPIMSINVIIQRAFMEDDRYGSFELISAPSASPGAIYDLSFVMIGRPSGWRITLEYNSDLFGMQTAQCLLDAWRDTMQLAVARPEIKLSELPPPRLTAAPSTPGHASVQRALLDYEGIADAIAVRDLAAGPNALYAYVTPAPTMRHPLEALPRLLMAHLEHHQPKLPSVSGVSIMLALPRAETGEIDYSRLPPPTGVQRTSEDSEGSEGNQAEQKMIEIWSDVLCAENITPQSNFFDLGGDSLSALRMIVRAERLFGRKLEVASLFRTPTVRMFARQIPQERLSKPDYQIVPIQPRGSKTPVISINNTIMYHGLAQRLGTDHPFIGVQLFDPTNPQPISARPLEEIAREYVELIRSAQPKGPYVLIGLCVAGAVAFEAAQQLKRAGESVPLLVMMDTWVPQHFRKLPWPHRTLCKMQGRVRSFKRRWARLQSGAYNVAEFLGTYGIVRKLRLLDLAAAAGIIKEVPPREDWDSRWFLPHLIAASERYAPQPYDGDALVFISDEVPTGRLYDSKLGWREIVTGDLNVHCVCRGHMHFFEEPSCGAILDRILPYLEKADAQHTIAAPQPPHGTS